MLKPFKKLLRAEEIILNGYKKKTDRLTFRLLMASAFLGWTLIVIALILSIS